MKYEPNIDKWKELVDHIKHRENHRPTTEHRIMTKLILDDDDFLLFWDLGSYSHFVGFGVVGQVGGLSRFWFLAALGLIPHPEVLE